MEAFPFTETEWQGVMDAALPVVNASLAEDAGLHASHLAKLLDVIDRLRERYGDHPALLETEADFTDDREARIALYRRAIDIATRHGLSTRSIRLSLARVYLDSGRPGLAAAELAACEPEMADADEGEQAEWSTLDVEARLGLDRV